MKNRVLPLVLALSLVGTTSLSTYAAEPTENTMKDENIYTNLHYDGSVDQVYVVNQFNLASAGTITDYGDYTKTKNMTTLEEITVQQGKTSIQAPAGKFYYQGYLDTKEIPWLVEIHYYLDGKELPGEQLAGKSGALKITLSTRPNPAVNPVYFANFALQISASFDNENCENLSAYDAGSNSKGTVVNVGGQKQVNFIALPDKEKDYVITADVRNFEMDGIKLNGMALSIAIDDPDISSLLNDIYTLQDAAFSLDDAALSMQGGVNDLDDAAEKINDGTRDLKNGVEDANTGAKTLDKAVHTAAGSSELEDAMKEFGSQLEQFGKLLGNQSVVQKDEILVQEDGDTITRTAAATTEEDKSADSPAEQPPVEPAPPAEQPPVEPAPPAEQPPVEPVPPAEQPPVEPAPPAEQPPVEPAPPTEQPPEEQPSDSSESELPKPPVEQGGLSEAEIEEIVTLTRSIVASEMSRSVEHKLLESGDEELVNFVLDYKAQSGDLAKARNRIRKLLTGEEEPERFESSSQELDRVKKDRAEETVQMQQMFLQLCKGYETLCEQLASKTGEQMQTLSDASGDLYEGTRTLGEGASTMRDGSKSLNDASKELLDGVTQVADATLELRNQTADLDIRVDDKVKEMIDKYRYDDYSLTSFVSPKNVNIHSVQFILRTPDIEIPEEDAPAPEKEQQLNFWQKVATLFEKDRRKEQLA